MLAIAGVLAAGLLAGAPGGTVSVAAGTVAASDCGIVVHRKPDGSRWRCTFGDDFRGTRLDTSKWRVMTSKEFNFGRRNDCYVNTPRNVSVGLGVLTLTARREQRAFTCNRGNATYQTRYTAGMVSTFERHVQKYGRFEFRARLPYTAKPGVQTSMWLWPDGETGFTSAATGEIDVAEWYSHVPDRVIPYLHYSTSFLSQNQATNNYCVVPNVGSWHTYLLEWSPKAITISFDGKQCLHNTAASGSTFNRPFMLSMFQGFGLRKNAPTAATPGINRAQFAWVRMWS